MSTRSVRVLKQQWYLISDDSCSYQIEGRNIPCYFTESVAEPTEAPNKNRAGTPAFKTLVGGQRYRFKRINNNKLWAYRYENNGAVVIVDEQEGLDNAPYSTFTAFGEIKTAPYNAVAAWAFSYDINSILINNLSANGGSVSQLDGFAVIQTGTAVDGIGAIETKKAVRYQPGVGCIVRFTAVFDDPVADSMQIIGYGDSDDGLFFGYNGVDFCVIRRSAGVDNVTAIDNWSDGVFTGFNPQHLNVYQIQFQWLGGGEIRFFVEDPEVGGFILAHRIKYANTSTDVSLINPSLPIRAEVSNNGNATNLQLKTPSATCGYEGEIKNDALKIVQGASGLESVGATLEPIVSVRNPLTYKGLANRLATTPTLAIYSTAGTGNTLVQFRAYINATLTGASWSVIDVDGSPIEEDTSATAITGGRLISGVQLPIQDHVNIPVNDVFPRLEPGDILTIAAISSGSTVSVGASLTLKSEAS